VHAGTLVPSLPCHVIFQEGSHAQNKDIESSYTHDSATVLQILASKMKHIGGEMGPGDVLSCRRLLIMFKGSFYALEANDSCSMYVCMKLCLELASTLWLLACLEKIIQETQTEQAGGHLSHLSDSIFHSRLHNDECGGVYDPN
jgi:hypothetical protein